MIALALRSGISPSAWLAEPPGYIETALDLLSGRDGEPVERASEFDIDMSGG